MASMKQTVKQLLPGVLFTLVASAVGFGGYVGHLLLIAKPGFVAADSKPFTLDHQKEVVSALIKLSHLCSFVGSDKYSALFIGSAGVISANFHDQVSENTAKYHLYRALELSRIYGDKSGDFNPYLEANFHAALTLKDLGEVQVAKSMLTDAINFAELRAPSSYWKPNLRSALALIEKR